MAQNCWSDIWWINKLKYVSQIHAIGNGLIWQYHVASDIFKTIIKTKLVFAKTMLFWLFSIQIALLYLHINTKKFTHWTNFILFLNRNGNIFPPFAENHKITNHHLGFNSYYEKTGAKNVTKEINIEWNKEYIFFKYL